MAIYRKIYNIISLVLPIAYLTLALDHGNIQSLVILSSVVMVVAGIGVINTYDGPPASELRTILIGRPPVMPRIMVLIYGFVAVVVFFFGFMT